MKVKIKSNTVPEFLTQLKLYFLGESSQPKYVAEEPLRSELFSSDQMEIHSKSLAATHKLTKKKNA